jgi:ubiquinone biosynthesis protein UbiJ
VISSSAALAFNHLLEQQPRWRERLARHAGMSFDIGAPPLPGARLEILESGQVAAGGAGTPPGLTVRINPLALPLLLARSQEALKYVETTGDEALATTVRELLIELRWDFEEDLSRVVGDVAAHRAAQAGRDAAAWQRDALERLARNFSEYWTEERPLLARRLDFEAFARDLQALRSSVERVAERVRDLDDRVRDLEARG